MSDLDLTQPLQTNAFTFNVPCREFVISAQVTRDRRMPMVDEFILRALDVVETVSVGRLARYFGFEGRDLGIALSELQARSLVTVSGNDVSLHPSAKELFRTATDSAPVLPSVEMFHARVWFDLISQSMVSSRGRHGVRHLLNLRAPTTGDEFDASFARAAFDANFRDYMRTVRKGRSVDDWSLYAILDVQPSRFSYAQIAGTQELVCRPTPKLNTVLLTQQTDLPARIRRLTDAMYGELEGLQDAESSIAAKSEWGRLFNSDSLERASTPEQFLDLAEWLRLERVDADEESFPFVGNLYLERNRRQLNMLLAHVDSDMPRDARDWTLVWQRPGGNTWGATEDLSTSVSDIRAHVRRWTKGDAPLVANLVAPAVIPERDVRRFDRIFDRGFHSKAGQLPLGLEILTVSDVAVAACVMVPLSSSVRIPVGRMTIKTGAVANVAKRVRTREIAADCTLLWGQRGGQRISSSADAD